MFLGDNHERNERRTWIVIAITAAMMVIEITAGTIFGSMALVADGWHMSTHAGAMLIAALAYAYARKHARNPRFTFGTGKLGDLAGFASAVVLALIALLISWESLVRLYSPVAIDFSQAIAAAVAGLGVNLLCAWLLRDDHHHHGHHHHGPHHHDHDHDHDHDHRTHGGSGQDNNLRAAYLHVLADALTSVLAIAALVLGGLYGWTWMDPAMGIVGGLVIARWSWGLIRDTG
ncbi:CDF family Co(II)/Ni(II) efflux transporter DmeF, partial [Rhodobacter sp. NSM]|uniref:CDF family Co(II)/Ni(II) efflux transporter DmeF n=1 Tax=Rhodobacter sp. NSM TaxID=3457501 RepID=UPI003FCF46F1